jgi:hypothetical protein
MKFPYLLHRLNKYSTTDSNTLSNSEVASGK